MANGRLVWWDTSRKIQKHLNIKRHSIMTTCGILKLSEII